MFWEMHFWVPGKLLSFRKVSCTYKSTSKQAQSKSITVSVSSILELIIIHCIWNALLFTEIYILSSTFSSQIFQGFHKIHQHLKQTWIANAHKDFWKQNMHAKFLFAQMMLKVFLITCILMKINSEVIISLKIT